jgi:hypothetical protein
MDVMRIALITGSGKRTHHRDTEKIGRELIAVIVIRNAKALPLVDTDYTDRTRIKT